MDDHEIASKELGNAIVEWLADEALRESEPAKLFDQLCGRLRAIGTPVMRAQVGFRVLHPLYDASTLTWYVEKGVVVENLTGSQQQFLHTPPGYAVANGLPVLRRRLTGATALLDFELLKELRAQGGTDYLAFVNSFDAAARTGFVCSWLGDRATGFTDGEIAQLRRVTRELGIPLKSKIQRSVAQNVAEAYLGKHAGRAVLSGSIRRGDGEKITAGLWYSDLRRSTQLSERLSTEDFLNLLGRYFEMTASAVLDHGGEVISLIGDAVLGLFRVESSAEEACGRALAAAQEARRRLAMAPPETTGPALDFGIALHLGQVIYGNVGVPERLQFTVVGAAVNEVVRVQDLTKTLGCSLLATAAFADAAPGPWRSLGEHLLRGFETPVQILTTEQPVAVQKSA